MLDVCEREAEIMNLSDYSFEILQKVFAFNVSKGKYALPDEIQKLVPVINSSILESKNRPSGADVIENLKLRFCDRAELMSLDLRILENPAHRHKHYNREAVGHLILQSACFGMPLVMSTIPEGQMLTIFKALLNCLKLLPRDVDLVFLLFREYYGRLQQMSDIAVFLLVIDGFLTKVGKYAEGIVDDHVSICFTIISRVLSDEPNMEMKEATYKAHLLCVADILVHVRKGVKIDESATQIIFEGTLRLFREKSCAEDLKFAFLKLSMELMRISDIEFPELFEVVVAQIEGSNIAQIESPRVDVDEEILERTAIPIFSEWLADKAPKVNSVFRALRSESSDTNRAVFKLLLAKSHHLFDTMNLDFIAVMLLLLNHAVLKGETLMDLVLENQCFSLFFGDALFYPEVTIFHYPKSPVVSLRSLSVRLWSSYMSDRHLCGFLISCFCKFLNTPELFAELYFLTQSLVPLMADTSMQGFIDCLGHEMMFQQKWMGENRDTIRNLTVRLFALLLRNKRYREIVANCEVMCEALFKLFSDDSILIQQCIDPLLPYGLDDQTAFYKALVAFIRDRDLSPSSFEQILMLFQRDLQSNKRDFLNKFAHSTLVPLVLYKVKDFVPMTEGILTSILLVLSSIVKVDREYMTKDGYGYQYWEEISPQVIAFEYSETIFECLCCMVSRDTCFTGCESPDVYPIVETIVRSKYQNRFLKLLLECTTASCVQCFILYQMNFLDLLADIIVEQENDEEIQLLFDLFCNITKHVCSRQMMFRVLQLLKPISNGRYHNPNAKYVFESLQRVAEIAKKSETMSSVMIFRSSSQFIWLPKAAFSDFSNGIVFTCWLKIPFVVRDWMPLLTLSDHLTEISYLVNRQYFAVNETYTVPVVFPRNRWFNIILVLGQSMGSVGVFVDGKQMGCLMAPVSNINQVESATMFQGSQHAKGRGLFGGCAMWQGGVDEAIINDIMSTRVERFESLADKYKMLMMYTPRNLHRDTLINVADKHIGDGTVSCDSFPFVKNLFEVFTASKGLHFLLSTFVYAELPEQDGTVTGDFLCGLIKTVLSLLMCSDQLHVVMENISGFNIIAHFLTTLQPEFRDEKLWNAIREVNFHTGISAVAQQFYQRIIFDISLWIHGDDSFILVIIMHWNVIAVLEEKRLTELIPTDRIIDIVYCLIISEKLENEDIRDQVAMLLMRFASHGFSRSDITMIIELMELSSTNTETIVMLMEVLNVDKENKGFVLESMMASDRIVNHLDLRVRTYFILNYVREDPAMLNEMLFIIVKEIPDMEQSYIDMMADQIYEVIDDLLMPFAIVISFFCDAQKEQMIKDKIYRGIASGQLWIGSDTSPFNILLLTVRAITGWTELGKRIGPIVAGSLQKLQEIIAAIDMIEAVVPVDDHNVTTFILQLMTRATQIGLGTTLDFLELISDFMFFGIKEERLEKFDLCILVDKFAKGAFEHKLGLKVNNGKVRHGDIAVILCQKIVQDVEDNEATLPPPIYVYYYYLYGEYGPEIDELLQQVKPDVHKLAPLLLKHRHLCEQFGVSYDEQLMSESFNVLEEFYATRKPLPILRDNIQDLIFAMGNNLLNQNMHKYELGRHALGRYWKKLWNSLAHERSPFLDVAVSNHYKRSCSCDSYFRPILLVKNRHFGGQNVGGVALDDADIDANNDHANSPVLWSTACERIRIMRTRAGKFSVIPEGFIFVNKVRCRLIANHEVKFVFWAWTNQVADSFQIYTTTNKLFYFRIPGKTSHKFLAKLKKIQLPNLVFFQESPSHKEIEDLKLTAKWRTRTISNFEYLMFLNLLSGRSFHNPSAYPIFPQVLADIHADRLDFDSPDTYKDLRTPPDSTSEYPVNGKYVAEALVRIEPFTTLSKQLNDGKTSEEFVKSWIDISKSTNRGIPDIYFCPEFLRDSDGLGLEDVVLPKWASDPAHFVEMQRRALESNFVSERLHFWIDSIWGVDQNATAYDCHIRPDVWQTEIGKSEPDATRKLCKELGQVPRQLFFEPHPARDPESQPSKNQEVIVLQNIQAPVIQCQPVGHSFKGMKVFSILQNGQFLCMRFIEANFEVRPNDSTTSIIMITSDSKVAFFKNSPSFVFSRERSAAISVFNGEDRRIVPCQSSPHLGEVTCISVAGDLILTGGADACFALWSYKNHDLVCMNYLLVHKNVVTCCCANETYSVAVTCSTDDTLIVSRLPKLQLLRVVPLDLKDGLAPKQVHVTERSGHIVVVAESGFKSLIRTYTLNGIFVTEHIPDKKAGCSCVAWKGALDLVIVVEGGRTLAAYDAFTLQRLTVLWQNHCPLLHVQYHPETNHVIATTADMKIQFIPLNL